MTDVYNKTKKGGTSIARKRNPRDTIVRTLYGDKEPEAPTETPVYVPTSQEGSLGNSDTQSSLADFIKNQGK